MYASRGEGERREGRVKWESFFLILPHSSSSFLILPHHLSHPSTSFLNLPHLSSSFLILPYPSSSFLPHPSPSFPILPHPSPSFLILPHPSSSLPHPFFRLFLLISVYYLQGEGGERGKMGMGECRERG